MKTDVLPQNINYTPHTFVPFVRLFIITIPIPYRKNEGIKLMKNEVIKILSRQKYFFVEIKFDISREKKNFSTRTKKLVISGRF